MASGGESFIAGEQPRHRGFGWLWRLSQEQIVLIVTAILVVVFSFSLRGFATLGTAVTLLSRISVLGILSLGAARTHEILGPPRAKFLRT